MKYLNDYRNKLYGGFLGKIIGVIHGANIEGWTYERIKSVFGEICEYPFKFKNFCSDDDINGPIFYMRALKDFSYEEVDEKVMAHTLMNYIADEHGFFWWGGYGVSTEHTAYENLKNGILAPQSGSIEQNGKTIAEQIGGQIFSDCWGLLCPGDIERASYLSTKMASVTHDGDGIEGAKFIAACIAAAFTAKNMEEIMEAGLHVLSSNSHYASMVQDVMQFCRKNPDNWEQGFLYVKNKYGYQHYEGVCHIIPNAAVIVLAMSYGKGDFDKTINIGNMCGWDTDCNVGNLGAILGTFTGAKDINEKWVIQVNDFICASSVLGNLNIQTISQVADLAAYITHTMYQIKPDSVYQKIFSYKEGNYIHFEYPHATGAFRGRRSSNCEVRIKNIEGEAHFGKHCLKVIVPAIENGESFQIYRKTYYEPQDFNDSRYDPDFSPTVYPGDKIETWVKIEQPVHNRIEVIPFIKDRISGEISEIPHQGIDLEKEEWKKISFQIPPKDNFIVEETGLIFKCKELGIREEKYSVICYVDEWQVIQNPKYRIDFKCLPMEKWNAIHQTPAHFTYLRGIIKLQNQMLFLSGSGKPTECYTGSVNWENYIFTAILRPKTGNSHSLLFRVQGALRNYSISMEDNKKLLLRKRYEKEIVLAEVPYSWMNTSHYTIKVECIENRIRIYLNENKVIEYEDVKNPLLNGGIGFGNRQASGTEFQYYRLDTV